MDSLRALPRERKLMIAAGGIVLFLVALIALEWFGPFKATDLDSWWVPLVLAIAAGAYYVAELLGAQLPVAVTSSVALVATGLVCFWTVTHFLDGGEYSVGAWLGLVASVVALIGGWLVDSD